MKKAIFFFAIAIAIVIIACTKNSASNFTTDCSTTKSWSSDVSPIISSTCAYSIGCHGTGSGQGPGPLTTYQQVYNNRSAIRSAVVSGVMPQGSSLSTAQKNVIVCWIDNGAVNN